MYQLNCVGKSVAPIGLHGKWRWGPLAFGFVMASALWWSSGDQTTRRTNRLEIQGKEVRNLAELLAVPVERLGDLDVGRINLLCAESLPASEDLDMDASLARLDEMALRVRKETERHLYRFQQNPAEFENSANHFRMIMLAVVLAEDFQVQYTPNKVGNLAKAWFGDGFFADSRDVFLHGLTRVKPRGTCSSLPVLQVAIGRRLGYPLKLVTTKGHLFVRWEDPRERFNIEAAGKGVNRFPDDYYRRWPLTVSEEEARAEGCVKSLSPAEEVAVFLSIRGMCLAEAGRFGEAADAFQACARLAPNCRSYITMRDNLRQRAGESVAALSHRESALSRSE